MAAHRSAVYFVVAGLNSFSTVLFFYYFYFFAREAFGFDDARNLWLAALQGGVYAVGSWMGGRAAERWGYRRGLMAGLALMAAAWTAGIRAEGAVWHIGLLVVATLGMSCTWPALEALVTEGQDRSGMHRSVGVYNLVWAGTGALAYFTGGAVLEWLGMRALHLVPLAIVCSELVLLVLAKPPHRPAQPEAQTGSLPSWKTDHPQARRFLLMAWLANPLAYMAIQTLIAVMPGVTTRLGLSTTWAGMCASIWCFARLGAFALLGQWAGWHYRFGWLAAGYATLTTCFALILLAPSTLVLILAQIGFGLALGLIYSSSLFYSMDAGPARGQHGGIHEAAIGLGNMSGPLIGALALQWGPQTPRSDTIAITCLLVAGGWILWKMRPDEPAPGLSGNKPSFGHSKGRGLSRPPARGSRAGSSDQC